jgi:hypothetical protein
VTTGTPRHELLPARSGASGSQRRHPGAERELARIMVERQRWQPLRNRDAGARGAATRAFEGLQRPLRQRSSLG